MKMSRVSGVLFRLMIMPNGCDPCPNSMRFYASEELLPVQGATFEGEGRSHELGHSGGA